MDIPPPPRHPATDIFPSRDRSETDSPPIGTTAIPFYILLPPGDRFPSIPIDFPFYSAKKTKPVVAFPTFSIWLGCLYAPACLFIRNWPHKKESVSESSCSGLYMAIHQVIKADHRLSKHQVASAKIVKAVWLGALEHCSSSHPLPIYKLVLTAQGLALLRDIANMNPVALANDFAALVNLFNVFLLISQGQKFFFPPMPMKQETTGGSFAKCFNIRRRKLC